MHLTIVHHSGHKEAAKTNMAMPEPGMPHDFVSETEAKEHPETLRDTDLVMVIAELYEEQKTLALCRALRELVPDETPLLVAISIYQMPLANRVKELPKADSIFMPLKLADLETKHAALTASGSGDAPTA